MRIVSLPCVSLLSTNQLHLATRCDSMHADVFFVEHLVSGLEASSLH